MDEVDEALAAIEGGDDSYWIIEALALEVRCARRQRGELDAARATMQGLHDQLIGGGPYPTFDEIARTLGAALDATPTPAGHARVAELEAENAKLRTQRQHLSDWSGTSIAEIDRMYAAGELG